MILIVDAGSQYTPLIESVLAYKLSHEPMVISFSGDLERVTEEKIKSKELMGVILSGGPNSASDFKMDLNEKKKKWLNVLIDNKIPILGICFGLQYIVSALGGKVEKLEKGEFGKAELLVQDGQSSELLKDIQANAFSVWMSHNDGAISLPAGFEVCASTKECANAVVEAPCSKIYLLQFHPEVKHTRFGTKILENFLAICAEHKISEAITTNEKETLFDYSNIATKLITDVRETVGSSYVLLALSGGVDSSALFRLLVRAIPGMVHGVFVDTGLMRKNEVEEIVKRFSKVAGAHFHCVEARAAFFKALDGLKDPELKRKAVGRVFVEVFEQKAASLSPAPVFLAQGTILPDVIESQKFGADGQLIKSHHNVGGLPERLGLKLLEPFKALFKDQVRFIGKWLGMTEDEIQRHPFPGPGLSLRVTGKVTEEKVRIAREADAIFIGRLREAGLYTKVSQAFAVLLPIKAVGVVGDKRRYGYCVVLRAVSSEDFMTAKAYWFERKFLDGVATEIIGKIEEIARVLYDITSKPPGTIEME